MDGSGNLYIGDSVLVYKEAPQADGSYTQTPIASGLGAAAGVAVDASGSVYIADSVKGAVYKETYSGGKYAQTRFSGAFGTPDGVAIDGIGNVYVSDAGISSSERNSLPSIFKETPSKGSYTRSTIAKWSGLAGLEEPEGLAVDSRGTIYVADPGTLNDDLPAIVWQFYFGDPQPMYFDQTDVGTTSSDSPKKTTVFNFGNAPLRFSQVTYPIDFPESLTGADECDAGTSLGTGDSCNLTVDFSPIAPISLFTVSLTENVNIVTNTLNMKASEQSVPAEGVEQNNLNKRFATLNLGVSADPATMGSRVIFTATVEGMSGFARPIGTVAFYSGTNELGTAAVNRNDIATLIISSLAMGMNKITTIYSGDPNYYAELSSNSIDEYIAAAPGASISGDYSLGTVTVGTTASAVALTVRFDAAETLGSIAVLTQGAPGQDSEMPAGEPARKALPMKPTPPARLWWPSRPGMPEHTTAP